MFDTRAAKMALAIAVPSVAIALAVALAIVPVGMSQAFAQDFPGSQGQGHDTTATNRGGQEKDPDSAAAKCTTITAGKSDNPKFQTDDKCD
jgi:hypothetical protein